MALEERDLRLKAERLRKISDVLYQEANPPTDRHRPLEWRRDFKFLKLPLKNIEIQTYFSVHAIESHGRRNLRNSGSPWQWIKPDVGTGRRIKARVDNEQFEDRIYCAVVDDADKQITRLETPDGVIQLILKAESPSEGNDELPNGIYGGSCFRMNYPPGEDYLCFEMHLPETHLNALMASLDRDPSLKLNVSVYLQSFSYEVDDFLGHGNYPQNLFIEEYADVAVSSVNISTAIVPSIKSQDEAETQLSSTPFDLSPVTKSLGRLTFALWVLIAVISYLLIK